MYDKLKPKEGEESKDGEFNASKRWFDNFRKSFALKSVKITGKVALAAQEAADEFPAPLRKSLRRKDICLNRFLMQAKVPYSRTTTTKKATKNIS